MTDPPQENPMESWSIKNKRTVQGQVCGITSIPLTIRAALLGAVHVLSP